MGQGLKKRLLGAGVLLLLLVLLAPSLFKGGDSHPLSTADEGTLTNTAERTPVEEFVDAFVEGITPADQKMIAENQQLSDIHASEVIDAYAGIVDKSLQESTSIEATASDITEALPEISVAAMATLQQEQSLTPPDALSSTDLTATQLSSVSDVVVQKDAQLASQGAVVGDDTAFLVIKNLPATINPQTGEKTPDLAITQQQITQQAISSGELTELPEADESAITKTTDVRETTLPEQSVELSVTESTADPLLTASEAQAAQAAIQSALPEQAPEIPAFVAALDKPADTIDVQNNEQTPVAVTNAESGIDAIGSLKAWALQLATFSDESNAVKLQDTLRLKGHTAYIRETQRTNGRPLYRVYIGPEVRTEELDTLKAQLEKEMGLSGMVVRFKS